MQEACDSIPNQQFSQIQSVLDMPTLSELNLNLVLLNKTK